MPRDVPFSYRQNLEPAGEPLHAGAWQLTPLLDPLSERRFLHYRLESRVLPEFLPGVLAFRAESVHALAPDMCPALHSLTVDGGRIEFLTDDYAILQSQKEGLPGLDDIVARLISTLALFERAHLHVSDLFPEAIGIALASDQSEHPRPILLPNAYVLPYLSGEGRVALTSGLRVALTAANKLRTLDWRKIESDYLHVMLIADLINQFATEPWHDRITVRPHHTEVAEAVANGDIESLWVLHERLFGESLDVPVPLRGASRRTPETSAVIAGQVERVATCATSPASVTILRGESYTGKSYIMQKARGLLERSNAFRVQELDEWDLFERSKKRAPRKGKAGPQPVWMIDDIDEKAFAYSDFAAMMLEHEDHPPGSVVLSVRGSDTDESLAEFLDNLRKRRGEHFVEVVAGEGNGDDTALALEHLDATLAAMGIEKPASRVGIRGRVRRFLDGLVNEERRLMEFLAVARFAMPMDLVLSVFSESGPTIRNAILHLASLDVLELFYRPVGPRRAVSLFIRVESTMLRRAVYDTIPRQRRARLHRSITLIAEQHGTFPVYFLIFHGIESGEPELAARHAVAYLEQTSDGERHPYIVSACTALAHTDRLMALPLPDQLLLVHEITVNLLERGRPGEAESLLREVLRISELAEKDQQLKNARRLGQLYRLLAERRETRGEFKLALDVLDRAWSELRAALPIPEQAQLLNDIGWLQYRLGDYEKSMESCRLSLNTLDANQYPGIVAQALNLMGVVHFNTSRYDQAISYYEQSAFLRKRLDDRNALAASYNNLALAYQAKGEYEKALDYYDQSLKLKQEQNNRVAIAGGYLNLALLYIELRKFEEAEEKCRESLAICDELENVQLAADNYITLGDIALEGGDFVTAEQHYQASRQISHQREAINEEMGALRRLSSLCLKGDRIDEARRYAEAAETLVRRIGSKFETAQLEVIFGDLDLKQDRPMDALEHLEKAAQLYTTLLKSRLAATVLSKVGLVHCDTGATFEARQYLDRAQEFIRTDIGRELPDEFVQLQQRLHSHPPQPAVPADESQKLLMAFYELSALADYAQDRNEFLRRFMDVASQIVGPGECFLALKTSKDNFFVINRFGVTTSDLPREADTLFHRTMLLARPVDSGSKECADLLDAFDLAENQAFVSLPLKGMGEDIGCLMFYSNAARLPLSNEDIHFYTSLARQLSSNLRLMLYLNEDFLRDELLRAPVERPGREDTHGRPFEHIIGKSEAMQKIFRTLEKVKGTDSGILIMGESGTGKSVLARAIHAASPRHARPFQEIHCAQIPHDLLESELFGHERGSFTGAVQRKLGLCEVADGGTLFLDDINVMPVETQTKLLHFIESKSFNRLGGTQRLTSDVRIIAASNEDLNRLCRDGKFREDLYFRLKVILIDLPPLRERKEDMLAIATDYLRRTCGDKGIPVRTLSPETIELFQEAEWRGNVRELQNVLERVVIMSDDTLITPASLPDDFLREVTGRTRETPQRLEELVDEIVRQGSYSEENPLLPLLEAMITKRLVEHVGGKSKAASLLGISKPTLYARLRDYDRLH